MMTRSWGGRALGKRGRGRLHERRRRARGPEGGRRTSWTLVAIFRAAQLGMCRRAGALLTRREFRGRRALSQVGGGALACGWGLLQGSVLPGDALTDGLADTGGC